MLMAANQVGETTSVDFGTEEICDELWVGAPLIGHTTDRKITNGVFYECRGWTDKTIKILDTEAQSEFEIPREATKHLRVGYAITYAAVQGRTLRESVRFTHCENCWLLPALCRAWSDSFALRQAPEGLLPKSREVFVQDRSDQQ